MPATGELIRMMNYMDDITATLRRITASLPLLTQEERTRLAQHMRKAEPSLQSVIDLLEKGEGK